MLRENLHIAVRNANIPDSVLVSPEHPSIDTEYVLFDGKVGVAYWQDSCADKRIMLPSTSELRSCCLSAWEGKHVTV